MTGTMDWAALGREIKARRAKLRLPQDMVDFGGPSEFTVRRLERAETDAIRPKTRKQLEVVLKWRDGLVDRILDGTATEDELAEVVDRKVYGPNERIPPLTHVKTGGGAGGAAGGGTKAVESSTTELATTLLGRLTADRDLTPEKLAAVQALSAVIPQLYEGRE